MIKFRVQWNCLLHRAVHQHFDALNRGFTQDGSREFYFARLSRCQLELSARHFAIDFRQQHRASGNEAAACAQAPHPVVVTESFRTIDINATETQWHRMHAARRASGGAHPKAAIEQRIVSVQGVIDPIPLAATTPHVRQIHERGRGHVKVGKAILGAPEMVVGEFVKVNLHYRRQHDGPSPVAFVHVQQRTLPVSFLRNEPHRRRAEREWFAMIEDEHRAKVVIFAANAIDFVFRVEGPDDVGGVGLDQRRGNFRFIGWVARRVGSFSPKEFIAARRPGVVLDGPIGLR